MGTHAEKLHSISRGDRRHTAHSSEHVAGRLLASSILAPADSNHAPNKVSRLQIKRTVICFKALLKKGRKVNYQNCHQADRQSVEGA